MNKAFESGVTGQPLIDQLKRILGQQMPGVGTEAGAAVGKGLDPAAAAAGQSAALTLSQEFAAAGTHIAAVISGIAANINSLTQTKPPAIQIDISPAIQQVASLKAQLTTITQKSPPKIQLDIGPAMQQIASLKNQIGGVKAKPIVINVSFKIIGKPPVPKQIKAFISYSYRIVNKIPNPPEIKRWISYKYRITNRIPNPPEIKRWISYRYRYCRKQTKPIRYSPQYYLSLPRRRITARTDRYA